MSRRLCICLVVFWIVSAFPGVLCSQTGGRHPGLAALENYIGQLLVDPDLAHASWSVCVMDLQTSSVIAGHNSGLSLIPASVMKVVTTASALALLDTNFRFETRLQCTGTFDSLTGTLHGDLYIIGGGDPTIGSGRFGPAVSVDSVFGRFIRALKKRGIKSVSGRLIGDESIFGYLPPSSWGWEDVGNYYGSRASGLSLNENKYRLYFDAGAKTGDAARLVRTEPQMPEVRFINNVKTAGASTGDNVIILGGPYTTLRLLEGTVPLGKKNFDVDGALPDPPMCFMRMFAEYLQPSGITFSGGYTTVRAESWEGNSGISGPSEGQLLCSYLSPPLGEIIYHTNIKSVNVFAEALLNMIGQVKTGMGSPEKGTEAVTDYLKTKIKQVDGFEMHDGCGLSRKNKITTEQLCRVFGAFYHTPEWKILLKSLPVAGESGGMRSLLKGSYADGNLRAKSGNMDGVRSYTGVVNTRSGITLAFAVIMNNYTCSSAILRQKCEQLMKFIAELD